MKYLALNLPEYDIVGGELLATNHLINHLTNFNIKRYPIYVSSASVSAWKQFYSELKQCWKFSKNITITSALIYSTRLFPLLACWLNPKTRRVPRFFHFHGFSHGIRFSLFFCLHYCLEAIAVTISTKVIVPTSVSIDQLRNRFPWINHQKIIIVPNGVDHKIFQPKSGKKNYFLWVGRPSPEKNLPLFYKIVRQLPQHQFHLALLGSTETQNLPNLTIKSNLTAKELAREYQHAYLTIVTSTTEQFPLTYLESIACGTPVITPPLPSLVSLQNQLNKHLIASSYKSQAFISQIKYFQNHILRMKDIEIHCHKLSTNYSWEKTAKKINDAILHV